MAQVVIAAVGFLLAGAGAARGVALIYTCLLLSATARAFQWPASSALLPQLVEPEQLTSAIGWQGTGREMATVTGPAVAGLLLAWKGSEAVYLVQALCALASAGCYAFMRVPARAVGRLRQARYELEADVGRDSLYLPREGDFGGA